MEMGNVLHVRGCKVIKKIFRVGKKIIILVTMKIFLYTNFKKKKNRKKLELHAFGFMSEIFYK